MCIVSYQWDESLNVCLTKEILTTYYSYQFLPFFWTSWKHEGNSNDSGKLYSCLFFSRDTADMCAADAGYWQAQVSGGHIYQTEPTYWSGLSS
jgi:hypothetical protein